MTIPQKNYQLPGQLLDTLQKMLLINLLACWISPFTAQDFKYETLHAAGFHLFFHHAAFYSWIISHMFDDSAKQPDSLQKMTNS